jgi:pSer/pThr/pTyr-binding forkhead associated (FHA) protein
MEINRGDDTPILIAQTGPLNGQRWVIGKTTLMGRDPSCDIIIPDRQISRYHANLLPATGGTILEDLGSKNGTYCNGQKVESSVMLQDGDMIQIALVQHFVYLNSDSTIPLDAAQLPATLRTGHLHMDLRSHRVWVGQQEVLPPLSAQQYRLLELLMEQEGAVVSRDELITGIWGEDAALGVSDQALDALVRRLRQRLAELDNKHTYVSTLRGSGIKFENPEV